MRSSAESRTGLAVAGACVLAISVIAVTQSAEPAAPSLAGCPVFPPNNVWNTPIDDLPVDANSDAYIASIGTQTGLHPDFGSGLWDGGPIGIPYTLAPATQRKVRITFYYPGESDPGPYPIPATAKIEGGAGSTGDRHVLVLQRKTCRLYEIYDAHRRPAGGWRAGSGAAWDLQSNALRPDGWTSADAAGLPILAGLVRYDEAATGAITHAIRFTAARTRREYVWPARHFASSITDPGVPPMGQRFRLKASVDTSGFSPSVRVILAAFKTYGLILADNGSNWYIGGVPDARWNNDLLVGELRRLTGSDFEAVDESGLMIDPDSGEARQRQGARPQ